ncbi:MAG: bifunctional phosphopantothenoylcysteine decarboxylase/phosphopantothenate--cysteine ligase CoaBC [Mycobacteriales bacterium]
MTRPHVVLGVAGGIAAYKSVELLRLLTESGYDVRVVPTANALRFVGLATWEALSGHPAPTDVWTDVHTVGHVAVGAGADLLVVAPATADLLAKAAHGLADDLLTNTLLTARCPVVFAPAMHTQMWEHPATQANVVTLRARGALVIDPAAGRLTGADSGVGRLPEPDELFALCRRLIEAGTPSLDLAGRRILVSAGGTREALDPVRFLGNRSSGRQGYALARTAVARGAEVTVVAANVALPDPAGAKVIRVTSAAEMHDVMLAEADAADAVVMAAAVADFRPADVAATKIKKAGGLPAPIELTATADVLVDLVAHRAPGQVVVGFAAETGDDAAGVIEHGREKLARKGCDLLVVNEVGERLGFESADNSAVVLGQDGTSTEIPPGSKESLADAVWNLVVARLNVA